MPKNDKRQKRRMAMEEIDLKFIGETLARVLDELRAIRNEQRRLAENQMLTSRAITALRDDLELMIRTEIGGLFAHLETRLEQRIDAAVQRSTDA
jgi:hypothetical protein